MAGGRGQRCARPKTSFDCSDEHGHRPRASGQRHEEWHEGKAQFEHGYRFQNLRHGIGSSPWASDRLQAFVAGQVAEDDHVALLQGGGELGLDAEVEE